MPATDNGPMLLHASEVAILSTILMGLILYAVIRIGRFGPTSLVRCFLASVACSALILGAFVLSVVLPAACGPVGAIFLFLGLGVGVILTLPLQLLIFNFPDGRGVIVWIVYMACSPLVVVWATVLTPFP